jgi:hypothetical protein
MDLHEIILPRQRGMHDHQTMLALMHKCNCGFVHRECHPFAEGGEGMEKAIIYLIKYEGLIHIVEYLHSIEKVVPGIQEEVSKVYTAWGKMSVMLLSGFHG